MMVVIFTLSPLTEKRFSNYGPMEKKKKKNGKKEKRRRNYNLKTRQKEEERKHLNAFSSNDINFN